MQPYTSPGAGDWSIRVAAAVVVDGAADAAFSACVFRRVGGHGLLVTGAARATRVDACDFYLPGGCGVVVVGYVPRANASEEGAAFPEGVSITQSIFEGIGVLGKQTSALFVSVACNVSISGSVLFSGPRSGINVRFARGRGRRCASAPAPAPAPAPATPYLLTRLRVCSPARSTTASAGATRSSAT
jgi:hypothetical protein